MIFSCWRNQTICPAECLPFGCLLLHVSFIPLSFPMNCWLYPEDGLHSGCFLGMNFHQQHSTATWESSFIWLSKGQLDASESLKLTTVDWVQGLVLRLSFPCMFSASDIVFKGPFSRKCVRDHTCPRAFTAIRHYLGRKWVFLKIKTNGEFIIIICLHNLYKKTVTST
jgi:hypothetical protein